MSEVLEIFSGSWDMSFNSKLILKEQCSLRNRVGHPSSTLVHEAGAAVLRLSPDKFWPFSAALFEHQKEYFDVNVVHEARNETYNRLAKLAGSVGVDESKVFGLLEISDKPGEDGSLNIGNQVTDDVKLMVKVRNSVTAEREFG